MGGVLSDQFPYGGNFIVPDTPTLDRVDFPWLMLKRDFHVRIKLQKKGAGSPAKSFTLLAACAATLYPVNAYAVSSRMMPWTPRGNLTGS